MTCKEKLAADNPDFSTDTIDMYVEDYCPVDHMQIERPSWCGIGVPVKSADCRRCWEREFVEPDISEPEHNEPTIKDSGDRTQFETGAVRDMRTGKGRCDLAPLRVAAKIMHGDAILDYIGLFQETNDTEYLYLAIRHFTSAFNGLADMLLEVAKHFEEGALKYGENNWQKGIPVHCYIDSAVRHYLKWLRGDKDEPHDRAFCWNLMCCIWEVDYREKKEEI